ncbi:MAG: cysteine-rich small domain-containing protein [Clostridia bacterium]|nr:cysteine-rich small domain-containing protein [Clostridia bacterium]
MKKNCSSFFQNRECEYFPCHDVENTEDFNCLFCFCPLYALGDKCGGNFTYTKEGIKDCSNCLVPHSKCGYNTVLSKFECVSELAKKKD